VRILFVAVPGQGHVQPLMGLALAACARGHAVAWATGPDACAHVRSCGLEAFEAGRALGDCIAQFRREHPEVGSMPGRMQSLHAFPALFGSIVAGAMQAPLTGIVERWRPDLIVSEPAALAAPLVARRCGVAQLTHEFGLPIPSALLERAAEVMAPAWKAVGATAPHDAGLYANAAVDIVPTAMRAASARASRAPRMLAQRPAPVTAPTGWAAPAQLASFLERGAGQPLLYVTFGTLNAGGPAWDSMLAALRDVPLRCVITPGPLVAMPADPPPRWHVERYVPQEHVLAHCSAVLSHAGAGVVLGAAAHGLPQLCFPQGADQFRNADALQACGAARIIEGATEPRALAAAVEFLLRDRMPQRAAAQLQAEIAQTPTAMRTAEALESLVAGPATGSHSPAASPAGKA
jgi:UDP:flavonoid glycosyltransferase YjiC (YdhE family)